MKIATIIARSLLGLIFVVFGSNMFFHFASFTGAQVWAFKRSSLGTASLKAQTVKTSSAYGSLLAANSYSATATKVPIRLARRNGDICQYSILMILLIHNMPNDHNPTAPINMSWPIGSENSVFAFCGAIRNCAAQTSGGTLDHPAMVVSLNVLGSLIVDIDGTHLDARFLDAAGAVRDSFRIVKGTTVSVGPSGFSDAGVWLGRAAPNPARNDVSIGFGLPRPASVRLVVLDAAGRAVRVLADGRYTAGDHRVRWDGRGVGGKAVASGVYFYRMSVEGRVLTGRMALMR